MNPTETFNSDRDLRHFFAHAGRLVVLLGVACMLFLAMGASANSERDAQSATMITTEVASGARTADERAWNESEDLRVGGYMGQPGIY